uniref:LITAF domain-containing protein n=1 Tax=Poecilia mexicana TaxID=48701 RepID=A0A3B3XE73_9TELE
MEKGEGPPQYTAAIPEMLAPPYPGPPLDSSVAPQPAASHYQQPAAQQYPQPVAQQYPQPAAQQYQQPAPQPNIQPVHQTVVQQNQATQPANPVVVQVRPTEAPVNMMCQFCKTKVMTVTEYKLGMLTWLIAGVLFIFGIWPCCLIPFFVGACKDVQHSCPQCNNVLHVYRRM